MKNEIRPLTGVRGVAAFLVMVWHFAYNPEFSFMAFLKPWKMYLCVDLFFILSGFVLALNYEKIFKYKVRMLDYGFFLKGRLARIYPAYFVIFVPSYIQWQLHLFDNPKLQDVSSPGFLNVMANLLLIQSWGFNIHYVLTVAWSVSTEVAAYIVFPLLLQMTFKRAVYPAVMVAGSVATLLWICYQSEASLIVSGTGPLDVTSPASGPLPLLRCLAGFSLGLVAYRISQKSIVKVLLSTEVAAAIALTMLALTVLVDQSDVLIVVAFLFLVICLYYNGKIVSAVFGNRVIHHLGRISYSLYLVHSLFRGVAAHCSLLVTKHYGYSVPYLFAFLGMTASWAFAYLSYRFVEVPCRRYINQALGTRLVHKYKVRRFRYQGIRIK